jgi:hypothetical protein
MFVVISRYRYRMELRSRGLPLRGVYMGKAASFCSEPGVC